MRRGFKKTIKKYIAIVLGIAILISVYNNYGEIRAAQTFSLTLSSTWQGARLDWTVSDEKIYKLSRTVTGENSYVAVGNNSGIMPLNKRIRDNTDTATINVLPVVPNGRTGNYLQNWFYGASGLNINVLPAVTFEDFNVNEDDAQNKYLYADARASAGRSRVNVDVIIFGTADTNGQADLSLKARQSVGYFIKYKNGGVIFAHDTIALGEDPAKYNNVYSNFWTLVKDDEPYNIHLLKPFSGYYASNNVYSADNQNYRSNESEYIKMLKQGLLTSAPYNINLGTDFGEQFGNNGIFKIAKSHNTGQEANSASDRWFAFTGSTKWSDEYSRENANSNFFLTTKGHTAMVQTGHSTVFDSYGNPLYVQTTTVERMILVNLIHYVAYKTSASTYTDTSANDINAPTLTAAVTSLGNGNAQINIKAEDLATGYTYKIEEFARENDITSTTPSKSAVAGSYEVKSGLKECYILIDDNQTVDENSTQFEKLSTFNTTTGEASISQKLTTKNQYIHVKAVDNNNNLIVKTYKIAKDSSSPIIMVDEKVVNDSVIDEKDFEKLIFSDITNSEDELDSGVAGYALSQDETKPDSGKFVTDVKKIDFHQFGSGYKYLWVKDNAGNYSKTKIYIHSDLIFKDSKGNEYEINKVEFNGQEMDQYYFGSDKNIFF